MKIKIFLILTKNRYNHRLDMKDADRFDAAVRQVVGKRITFDQLTGKNHIPSSIN